MAITSNDIQNQSFKIERRGYDVDEVDVFLERVASELDSMNDEIAQLRAQLAEAQRDTQQAPHTSQNVPSVDAVALAQKDARIVELENRLKERKSEDSAIAQALIIAQRTGDEIVSKAKTEAEQTRVNAEEEAKRILDKANVEKQKVVDRISELNASRESVREQYQDLLKEFIGSATKRLTEIGGDITEDLSLPTPSTSDIGWSSTAAQWTPSPSTATYTTPTVSPVVSAPATPKPSQASKDLSGYGDADDSFSFDEVD